MTYTRVAPAVDVADGAKKAYEVAGRSVLVCHAEGRWYAVSNLCSHAAEKLECGQMRRGWISCPAHGARFELATGRAMNAPAKQPIATYPVRIADEWIEILV